MDDKTRSTYFSFFNEIGIISQLSRTILENRLPDSMLVSHFSVLNHLIRVADGRTPQDIARAFQVPKTSMTHTLSVLEKHNLVEMRPNPKDGRSKNVWITGKGREFRDHAISAMDQDIEKLSGLLAAVDVATLTEQLATIRKIMDASRDEAE
ncbi:MarR family transcriptional regulator [Anderseniella sp. Alg231-50]|uniref:MarR family transcriptional regulator n=1 Tax=Anderseniella sp. Alg231-50 TaxID=1922226 RepID=UPI000D54B795